MWHDKQNRSKVRFWKTTEIWKDWSNALDRLWSENWVANVGLKEMWNGYEMLVTKGQLKQLVDSRILPALWGQILM